MFTLKIVFHGLVGFIAMGKSMVVVLPEARDLRTVPAPTTADAMHPSGDLHAHYGALKYKAKNADGLFEARILPLDGIELVLDSSKITSGDLTVARGEIPKSGVPNLAVPGEVGNFAWVPSVDDVAKRLGRARSEVLPGGNVKASLRKRIAARLSLQKGSLRVGSVSTKCVGADREEVKKARVFKFKNTDDEQDKKAIAETVIYEATVSDTKILLTSHPFGEPDNLKKILIEQKTEGAIVVLEVVNVESDFLLSEVTAEESDVKCPFKSAGEPSGEYFKWFYKLSDDNIGPFPVPEEDDPATGGKPYCSMVQFRPIR